MWGCPRTSSIRSRPRSSHAAVMSMYVKGYWQKSHKAHYDTQAKTMTESCGLSVCCLSASLSLFQSLSLSLSVYRISLSHTPMTRTGLPPLIQRARTPLQMCVETFALYCEAKLHRPLQVNILPLKKHFFQGIKRCEMKIINAYVDVHARD